MLDKKIEIKLIIESVENEIINSINLYEITKIEYAMEKEKAKEKSFEEQENMHQFYSSKLLQIATRIQKLELMAIKYKKELKEI